jgi:hypothetical protein
LGLVDRSCETPKVVEQEKNPVTPGFEGVQPVLKAWERVNLPEKFEMGTSHTVAVFRDNLDADRLEQVGKKKTNNDGARGKWARRKR